MAPTWDQLSPAAMSAMSWLEYGSLVASSGHWTGSAMGVGLTAAGAAVALAFGVPAVNRRILQPIEETRLWDFLPFDDPITGGLRMRDGSLTAAIRIAGLDMSAAGLEEIEGKRKRRRQWFADLDPNIVYRIFQARRRVAWRQPGGDPPTKRAKRMIDTWFSQFAESYVLETTIVLEVPSATQRARERLEEAISKTMNSLEPFGPKRLTVNGVDDPLLEFWGNRINPANAGRLVLGRQSEKMVTRRQAAALGYQAQIPELAQAGAFSSGLAFRLAGGWVETHPDGLIRHSAGGSADIYAYVVAVPMWGDDTGERMNSDLLRVRGEMTVVHRIRPLASDDAKKMVAMAANNAKSDEDDEMSAVQQKAVADERLSPISTNKESIGSYETWVICYGRTREESLKTVRQVVQIMHDYQMRPKVCERDDAEHLWFGQFPTYNEPLRNSHFFTSNLADLVLFENVDQGHSSCDWGSEPVLPIKTQFGTTFGLVPHASEDKEAIGHILVVGQPGSGKTKFLQLLATAASRFAGLQTMWFDRDFASAAWALAMDADYFDFVDVRNGLRTAKLNPLFDLDPKDSADQQYLRTWFSLLTELDDDEAMQAFGDAVKFTEATQRDARTLGAIASVAFGSRSAVSSAMQRWIDPHQLGSIWQSQKDGLSLSKRVNVFNMTSILEDPRLAPPVVSYLWYRHRRAVRAAGGAPSLVVVDETRALLPNPIMRKELLRELREGRRRRESVCLVFQEPSAIGAIGDSDFVTTMRGSFGTQVFFPISGSSDLDWAEFDLTPNERAFLKGHVRPDCRYPALIRKPLSKVSVVVDLDQSGLGEDELFMRGGQDFALAAHEARRVSPADPASEYLTRAHRIVAKIKQEVEHAS